MNRRYFREGNMSKKVLNVGVIGAGGIARNVHLPSLSDMEDINRVAICDRNEDKAVAMAEKHGFSKAYTLDHVMLEKEDLDAVFVLVEPSNHFHVVWRCLDAGLPVMMEKPPGINLYQAESLAHKAEEAGQILQVGFNRRHIPLVRKVVELVRERAPITQVEGVFFKFGKAAFDKGGLSAFPSDTIHSIDLMRSIAGGEPVAAATVIAQHDDWVENSWNGVCRFDNGATGIIKANYQTGGRVHKFEIHGPGISAYIDLGFGGASCSARILDHAGPMRYSLAASGAGSDGVIELDGKEIAGSDQFYNYYGFYHEDVHFLDCVREGRQPEPNIQEAVKSMRLMEMFLANRI
jgi:virulence factor